MTFTTEINCSKCDKREVCKFVEDYNAVSKEVEMIEKPSVIDVKVKCRQFIKNERVKYTV